MNSLYRGLNLKSNPWRTMMIDDPYTTIAMSAFIRTSLTMLDGRVTLETYYSSIYCRRSENGPFPQKSQILNFNLIMKNISFEK